MRTGGAMWVGVAAAAVLFAAPVAQAAALVDPLDRPALATSRAAQAFLTNVTRAGERLVAVGERGVIVLSDDAGRSWRQAQVPVSVTLTAVQFSTAKQGWAVGHSGVVLQSLDGGETWVRRFDGKTAAELVLRSARAKVTQAGVDHATAKKHLLAARRLVEEGPDKPFLDLFFQSETKGFVVGAYGLAFATDDGGKTWRSLMDRIDNPKGLHLYAVGGKEQTIYLAGEQGLFVRSLDGGKTFERTATPYRGTYFALVAPSADKVVLAGLRGNAYWSGDRGASWQPSSVAAQVSFNAVTRFHDGSLVFVNQAGRLLLSRNQGRSVTPLAALAGSPLAAVVEAGDGVLVAVGMLGATRLSIPEHHPELNLGPAR